MPVIALSDSETVLQHSGAACIDDARGRASMPVRENFVLVPAGLCGTLAGTLAFSSTHCVVVPVEKAAHTDKLHLEDMSLSQGT